LLKGLEISEVLLSELEFSGRLDSEYYKPSFLKYEQLIKSKENLNLKSLSNFLIGPFGSAFTVDNYVKKADYRYIRGKDVKPLKIKDNDNVYMPKADYERLSKYALKENDILVSVVGTTGNAALITKKDLPAIFSCKSTVLRPTEINSVYLLTYINTKYGKDLLLRKERGAIQKGLNLGDLESLDIFIPSNKFQSDIESFFRTSLDKTEQSKQTYNQAENILLQEIGLQDFTPSKKPVNVKSFKDSFATSGRLDAEYYQLKYEQVVNKVKNKNFDTLNNLVDINKSIEPGSKNYVESGLPFMRVADLSKNGLSEPQKYISDYFIKENEKKINKLKPKKGTILFSKDGSVGIAYHLRQNYNGITSGAILHLNVKDEQRILPEYLTLALNSKVVQMQAERDAGGSIILHWRVGEIENVVVPIIDFHKQREIADLIEQSFSLKKQSEHLLEVAKKAVEIAIEENEENALEYIKTETNE
jgi:restriction endonuclease S subunit